jgi:hypothetical protein
MSQGGRRTQARNHIVTQRVIRSPGIRSLAVGRWASNCRSSAPSSLQLLRSTIETIVDVQLLALELQLADVVVIGSHCIELDYMLGALRRRAVADSSPRGVH